MSTTSYPVHVDAHLDPGVSRWQWLFKWFLAIPHYILLTFLWLAFVAMSVVAFVAILFTGRYPRGVFDFNVGVLRWTWRVTYYAYGALGTDRYPPFSIAEHPEYPARLTIDYPEHLSRGLVLVKWWLLAIPHYLVLSLFLGGGTYVATHASNSGQNLAWSTGLIGLMVVIAGFALLFTGRYPQSVFDLVLGMNRWVLRVAGYAALMTDQYPPFRLDQGGDDPSTGHVALSPLDPRRTAPAPPRPTGQSSWGAGRVIAVVVGCLIVMGSLALALPATGLLVLNSTARDDAGFLMSPTRTFSSAGYALTSGRLEVTSDVSNTDVPHALLGDAKVTARATGAKPVFVGVARTADLRAYLGGVRRSAVVDFSQGRPVYRTTGGSAPRTPPTASNIWRAQSSGTGVQSVTWPVTTGSWTVVVMNADGSSGVRADVAAGATVPAIGWVVGGLWIAVGVGLLLGIVVLIVAVRGATRQQ
ncbi:MAG: hypothetical protein QOK15_1411 [Nocardioidaceae bacterium]|nr:hypothetical protein [Nocardioidaceae bacterium]